MLSRLVFQLVIFGWKTVSPSPRGMLMAIPVVVVPDGADVTRIGLEEELRNRIDARRLHAARRARSGSGRL